MIRSSKKIYPFYILTDLIFVTISFFSPYLIKYSSWKEVFEKSLVLPDFEKYLTMFVVWSLLIIINLNRKGFYSTDRSLSIPKEIVKVFLSILYVSILVAGLIFFTKYQFFSREIFIKSFILICIFTNS